MKTNPISYAGMLILVLFCNMLQAQNFGPFASAVWISSCSQNNHYNTSGTAPNLIGPAGLDFNNTNLGTYTQGSNSLKIYGAQVRTFKNPASSNVCGARMYYRVYLQSGTGGAFTVMNLPTLEDCTSPPSTFATGGPCNAGEQKWLQVLVDASANPPVDLTAFAPGNYVLEVYYEVTGSNSSTTLCDEISPENNG